MMLTGENGILNRTGESTVQTDIAGTREQIELELMGRYDNEGNYTNDDVIEAVYAVTGQTIEEGTATITTAKGNEVYISDLWKKFPKVGDYVNYTPDTAEEYSLTSAVAGGSSDQTITQENLTWRIMSINDDGSVDLVSTSPTAGSVYLGGALGFNNGVYVLNDLCKTQYSNSILGVTARSINLVDIERKFSDDGMAARDASTFNGVLYGSSETYTNKKRTYTPAIYTKVGKTAEEESKDYYTEPTTGTYTQKSSLTVTQTAYDFNPASVNYFEDSTFYEIVFGTGKSFWLATRCAFHMASGSAFTLRIVSSLRLTCTGLLYACTNNSSMARIPRSPGGFYPT